MFRCILGERESGKSVFVEDIVKKTDSHALYIATLPGEEPMYQDVIRRHQQRRPASWRCAELFRMKADEIMAYPYQDYQNVILDNLSYYVLYQIYTNKDIFVCEYVRRGLALLKRLAEYTNTMVYIVDTPLDQEEFLEEDERELIRQLFLNILCRAQVIERFYKGRSINRMTAEEGNHYMFCKWGGSVC